MKNIAVSQPEWLIMWGEKIILVNVMVICHKKSYTLICCHLVNVKSLSTTVILYLFYINSAKLDTTLNTSSRYIGARSTKMNTYFAVCAMFSK